MPKGICYVETKNLDGETNLKHKRASKEILALGRQEEMWWRSLRERWCSVRNRMIGYIALLALLRWGRGRGRWLLILIRYCLGEVHLGIRSGLLGWLFILDMILR